MSKKQTSIGRLKTITKPDGSSFNVLEITQDIELKKNDTVYLNDYVENVDFLVKAGLIDAAVGAERKAGAKRTSPKGTTEETRFVAMLQLSKREENSDAQPTSKNKRF
jgi:hypothetical protein